MHLFVILLPNFEDPTNFLAETLKIKIATKLLRDSKNLFEAFVGTLFIKFGKLKIAGYHTKQPWDTYGM